MSKDKNENERKKLIPINVKRENARKNEQKKQKLVEKTRQKKKIR